MSLPNVNIDPTWDFTLNATLPDNTPVPVVNYINALRTKILQLETKFNETCAAVAGGVQITCLLNQ